MTKRLENSVRQSLIDQLPGRDKRISKRGRRRIGKIETVKQNIERIKERIGAAARGCGRSGDEISVLAAVKNRGAAEVKEAIACGIDDIGENTVQAMLSLRAEIEDGVNWHFIGHLQTNKVKYIVGFVYLIHTVDSLRLALEIDKRAAALDRVKDVLIQVNVADEPTKYGLKVSEVSDFLRDIAEVDNIRVRGLSTIAPLVKDPEDVRWVFSELRELGKRIESEHDNFECEVLSMGMTNDFEVAVEEGSNMVRIGTAIFEGFLSAKRVWWDSR